MHVRAHARRRSGHALIYMIVGMGVFLGFCSLAVDLGRVQVVKTELQRGADATARGSLALYLAHDRNTAVAYGPLIAGQDFNPVDLKTKTTTTNVQWGRWNSATRTFTAGTYNPPAVRVTLSRTRANNNQVPLLWAGILGRDYADVTWTSTAAYIGGYTVTHSVQATYDPWLAGMPAGATASYNDTAPGQSPAQMSIPVVPGTYITFTSVTGQVRHGPTLDDAGPDGAALTEGIWSHMMDSPDGDRTGAQNGIADVVAPINAMLGLFLNDSVPTDNAAYGGPTPSRRNYTDNSDRNDPVYDDLKLRQPFFIGDGKTGTGSGTIQKFKVPPGATRFYMGIMDGYEWKNNLGSFSASVYVEPRIATVQ